MILRRLESSRFSEVLPLWRGRRVVILGGGPSLTREQVEMVRCGRDGGGVIAVNDAYLLADFADVAYFADCHWWRWHTAGIAKPSLGLDASQVRARWEAFDGQKCTIQNTGAAVDDDDIHILRNRDFPNNGMGLSSDPQALVTGRNSGFQALNLAILAGAKKVILLGFDGQSAANGKTHWFGDHPHPTPAAAYSIYRQAMSAAENLIHDVGVEVINCSPGSAIDSFPKMNLESVL